VTDYRVWLKTTSNCYIAEVHLEDAANRDVLDNCGPIGFIQVNYTGPYEARSLDSADPEPTPIPDAILERGTQMLINLTVGEDFAICYSCTNVTTCDVVKKYKFQSPVYMQCGIAVDTKTGPAESDFSRAYWYETTDWCFVKESDFFESIMDCEFRSFQAVEMGMN
jgi:hypothetical protein